MVTQTIYQCLYFNRNPSYTPPPGEGWGPDAGGRMVYLTTNEKELNKKIKYIKKKKNLEFVMVRQYTQ